MRAAATVVDAAHWPAVSTALFEEHVDELPLPGDKTDDGENESPTAAMEVNNEDNESIQSKTAAPAPAEHEAQLQQDKRKAESLLAELAAKALPAPPVEAATELVPAEAFDEVAATRAAKKLTVAKLRKALEATGASTAGLKSVLVARFVDVEWATAVVEHATAMASMPAKSENKSKEQYVALRWKGDNSVASLVALCTRHDKKPELVITAMTSIAPRHVLITLGLEKGRQFKRLTLIRKWEPALVEENLIPGWVKTECTGGEDVLVRCESNWKALIAFVPLEEVLEIEFKDGAMDVATAALKAAIADVAAPKTPAQRDTMLSSVTRRSLADETLPQSLSPLERIQNASRQVQGDKLDQSQYISAHEKNLAALTRKLDKAKDMNVQLRAWGRRCKEITKDSHSKTIDAEARLRRLIVGLNNAQMVSKERVRIRALEKNLGKVTRMYSMEKESHKETIESHKETIDRVEEIWAMKFEDNRIPYRVLIHFSGIVKSHTEENRNFLEDKIILNKELLEDKIILNKEDWMRAVDKDIEVNVERTKNAMRKDVQEKTAIIIERDERIDMLEKHLDKTCVERDCALATIAERDERIASLEKQLATTRALLYVSGPRNQQGPSPSSA